jgi:iron complex outermembrane receptor protein
MKNHKSLPLLFSGALAVLSAGAGAGAADPQLPTLSEEDFLAEIPVVLTATRLAQPINEAPAAMTIIDRQMIEASGAREIADLFRLVPGFQVNHDNGHTPIVTYNGLSDQFSRRMQVLVDGRSVYTPMFGGVDWAELPLVLDDIERIEVTRGPNAASFGANAFLAIINIITRHASETVGYFARYTTGSPDNIKDGVLRYGATTGDLDYRLTLGYTADDGFPDRYDNKRIHTARFRADYSSSARDTINFQAGYTRGSRGLDSQSLFPGKTIDKGVTDGFQQFRWNHVFDRDQELQVQYYHNSHHVKELWQMSNDASSYGLDATTRAQLAALGVTDFDIQRSLNIGLVADRHDLEIQDTLATSHHWRIAWGGSLRQDRMRSPGLLDRDSAMSVALKRLFANGEWRGEDHWLANIGAMWEQNDLSANSLSPRAALHYRFNNHHTLRLVASKATRTPVMLEKNSYIALHLTGQVFDYLPPSVLPSEYPLIVSTQDVSAEKITAYELGLNSTFPRLGANLDIKLFRNHITDLIAFHTSNGISTPLNTDDATVRGLESYLDFNDGHGDRAIFSYAYTLIDSDDVYNTYSQTVPLHNISILLSKQYSAGINTSLAFYRVTTVNGLESGAPIPAHNRADFRVAFPFRSNGMRGSVAFVSQNLLDAYRDWRDDNTFTSRHFVTISAQFD